MGSLKRGSRRRSELSVVVGGTEVSVVFVEVGDLPCLAGSLMIIPVVGMGGFSAGATLEDPLAVVLGDQLCICVVCS